MKCEVCLQLLEEYIDSALAEREAAQVNAHLTICANCANEFDALSGEQEIYARYDRSLEVAPSLWKTVEAVIASENRMIAPNSTWALRAWLGGLFGAPSFGVSLAGATAVLIVAAVIGFSYWRTRRQPPRPQETVKIDHNEPTSARRGETPMKERPSDPEVTAAVNPNHSPAKRPVYAAPKSALARAGNPGSSNQSDVLFSEVAYSEIEDQDTQRHIEQAQNLLRSVRNLQASEGADEIDVSYEKALSRRLLNENVVLRRDAEMSGKFPVKTLLSSLEPFLIDIANLPERASVDDLRVIKERVQKTEIVAALHTF